MLAKPSDVAAPLSDLAEIMLAKLTDVAAPLSDLAELLELLFADTIRLPGRRPARSGRHGTTGGSVPWVIPAESPILRTTEPRASPQLTHASIEELSRSASRPTLAAEARKISPCDGIKAGLSLPAVDRG